MSIYRNLAARLAATMLTLFLSASAAAMTIDFTPIVGTITGSDTVVVPFSVDGAFDTQWQLTDLETPAPFQNLGLAIATEDATLLGIINEPGTLDISLTTGNYLAVVGGIAGGDLNIGTFGLEISDLPVPGAVYLFASALLGFAGVTRKRRASL